MKLVRTFVLAGMGCAAVLFPTSTHAADTSRVRVRSQNIHLAQVRFENTRADAALDHLREAARRADPAGQGVNLVYRGDAGAVPSVTMHLRDISLYDILRYLAELTGLHMRIDAHAVVFSRDLRVTGRIETRIYPVHPSVLDQVRAAQDAEREPPFFFGRP